MKGTFGRIAWILVGLLGVAALMLSLGEPNPGVKPSVDSYAPSGTAALFSLLQIRGFKPSVDHAINPTLEENEIGLVFTLPEKPKTKAQLDAFKANLHKLVSRGGQVIIAPLDDDFAALAQLKRDEPLKLARLGKNGRSISGPITTGDSMLEEDKPVPLWTSGQEIYASLFKVGEGNAIAFSSGHQFTNRYIDKDDNAQVFLDSLATLAKPGTRIVFLEGGLDDAVQTGLLRTIGRWAEGAWFQILFLFGVVCYTQGKRFVFPEEDRPVQRGTRELLDAVADTYKRARASRGALRSLYKGAEAQLRRDIRVSRDASIMERNRKLSSDDALVLAEIEQALLEPKLPTKVAAEFAIKLEKVCENYGASKNKLRR